MDIDKLIPGLETSLSWMRFGSLMDIDKLIPRIKKAREEAGFGSLMDIDKLIQFKSSNNQTLRFGSLMENKNSQSLFRPWEFLLYTIRYPLAQPPQPVQPPVVPNTCSYSF